MANSPREQQRSQSGEFRQLLKAFIPGVSLIILGFAMMFAVIKLVPPEQYGMLLLFSSVGIICAGVIVFAVLGYMAAVRHFEKGLVVPPIIVDSFRQVGPDKAFETKKFSVFKKNDIYILLPKESFIGAYFIRLFGQAKVSGNDKVKLPFRGATGIIRKGRFQDEINRLSVAKSRGDFTVPTDAVRLSQRDFQERYVKGRGMLYFVFRYDLKGVVGPFGYIGIDRLMSREHHRSSFDLSDKFDKATILKIMEKLSKEQPQS